MSEVDDKSLVSDTLLAWHRGEASALDEGTRSAIASVVERCILDDFAFQAHLNLLLELTVGAHSASNEVEAGEPIAGEKLIELALSKGHTALRDEDLSCLLLDGYGLGELRARLESDTIAGACPDFWYAQAFENRSTEPAGSSQEGVSSADLSRGFGGLGHIDDAAEDPSMLAGSWRGGDATERGRPCPSLSFSRELSFQDRSGVATQPVAPVVCHVDFSSDKSSAMVVVEADDRQRRCVELKVRVQDDSGELVGAAAVIRRNHITVACRRAPRLYDKVVIACVFDDDSEIIRFASSEL